MPHISIVCSPSLNDRIDWAGLATGLHKELSGKGLALLSDLKTRVLPLTFAQIGDEAETQQIIATLVMTNERPHDTQRAMADIVMTHLEVACASLANAPQVQACVFFEYVPRQNYLKRDFGTG